MKCRLKLQILLPHISKIVYNKVMIIKKNSQYIRDVSETETSVDSESSFTEPKSEAEKIKAQTETMRDVFNIENIDFKQRKERRRGDRRRGFRRIDDRNLISRAREEAQSIRESAAKEGYEDGIKQAKSDVEEVKNAIADFMNAKQDVLDYLAPNIMEISIDIAKKIIKREIEQDPSIILDNISSILKQLSKEEAKITLKVNPIQVPLLKSEISDMMSNAGLDSKVMIVPDENIMEGGCMVTTTNGVIDATIETQLSVISEALKGL